ncbi:apolipoprotein N-acyltransferase [Ectothiorhodospiraceae bacterium 2226]|nr:apolipoprotein N-acyltransferase [Ectothiorhodospiraceae bacterium 2226]
MRLIEGLVRYPRAGDLAALLAGAALPLAFAPFHLWPLAVLAPLVLFALWLPPLTPRRAAWRGYLFGLGMFGVGVSWVFVAIHVFGETGLGGSLFLTGAFVAFLALFPATLGYVNARLRAQVAGQGGLRAAAVTLLLLFPATWTLWEWVRGWFFTGFTWLHLGYSQIDGPLGGVAALTGVYGLSWLLALTAGLLVYAWLAARYRVRAAGAAAAAVLLWVAGAALAQITWTEPDGEPLRVVVVQGNIPQEIRWDDDQFERTKALYWDLTRPHLGTADLVVWPENAIPGFYHWLADGYFAELERELRASGTDLMLGLPYRDRATGAYYNSVLTLGPDERQFYHKHHLVPFGEFVPLEQQLRGLFGFFDLHMSSFSRGEANQAPVSGAGCRIGVSVCYEDTFGEYIARSVPQANLLVNVTNNAWFGDSIAPHQHLQITRLRARETERPLVRATTNGISAVIDAQGHLVARGPQFEQVVLTGEVQPRRGATPYARTGNYPVIIALLLSVLAATLYARRRLARAGVTEAA